MADAEIAVFGGGCFWCTEAVFGELQGVLSVAPGYAGGTVPNPTYAQVCRGDTGHAEVIRLEYDPKVISYRDLLTVFFATHDPTQLNRQGNDSGTQYRSVVFYASPEQKKAAEEFIARLKKEGVPAVTEVRPLHDFFPAEDYHQRYYNTNPDAPYCQLVIDPKLRKLRERYTRLLKKN